MTVLSPVQKAKVKSPMVVTPLGIVTDSRDPQLENAPSPIDVTVAGITYDVSVLAAGYCINASLFFENSIPSSDSYAVFPAATLIVLREVQKPNGLAPMDVTVDGTSTDSSDLHPLNALLPIFVIPSGSVTDERDVQFANALYPMVLSVSGSVTDERDEQFKNAPKLIKLTGLLFI